MREERGQERGRGGGVVEWHLPHGERPELPPPPHGFDRRHGPAERPLAGGREARHEDGRGGGEAVVGGVAPAPPGSAPLDDRERQQMFVRGGAGGPDSPYERSAVRLGWPSDQMDAQQQQRSEHGRHGWDGGPHRGVPLEQQPREGRRYQWEQQPERGEAFASAFNPPAAQEFRRRGGENSRVALPPSSSSAFEAGRSSRAEEGEGGGRGPPAAPASAARAGNGQSDEQEPEQMREARDTRHRGGGGGGGREQAGDEGELAAPPRAPAGGDHPEP